MSVAIKQTSLFENNSGQESIRGTVTYVAQGSVGIEGWRAGRIRTKEDIVKFVGNCQLAVGDPARLFGLWEDDPKWGRQFRVSYAMPAMGRDYEAIRKIIELDPRFREIGPQRSRYIIEFLERRDVDLEEALEDLVMKEELRHEARLPQEALEHLAKEWAERREEYLTKAELISLGVKPKFVEVIWRCYPGTLGIDAVRQNPYDLTTTIDGFSLKDADEIAIEQLKLSKTDTRRLECGVSKALDTVTRDGHTWVTKKKLRSGVLSELELGGFGDHKKIADCVDAMIERQVLSRAEIPVIGEVFCPDWLIDHEMRFCRTFSEESKSTPNHWFLSNPLDAEWASRLAPDSRTPSDEQKSVVEAFTKSRFTAVTGPAGSGKTYAITLTIRVCQERGLNILLCAPTGKAAKRIDEMISRPGALLKPITAPQTIHKMLGYQGKKWERNAQNPLVCDVVIADEASMIDIPLMYRLLDALPPKAALVLVGDHNQLASVGPGAILRDIIEGEMCAVTRLGHVFRNAGPLRANAFDILRGFMRPTTIDPDTGVQSWTVDWNHKNALSAHNAIVALYRQRIAELGEERWMELQVLSPQYKGDVGIDALNASLRRVVHATLYGSPLPDDDDCKPRVGDRVIQTKNDYKTGLMNGDQGVIVSDAPFVDDTGRSVPGWTLEIPRGETRDRVNVPRDKISGFRLAYAISVHRFQGSEAEHVIGAVHSDHRSLNRKLIYTMATRASKTLTLVGDRPGMTEGVRRDENSYRRTLSAPSKLLEQIKKKDPTL